MKQREASAAHEVQFRLRTLFIMTALVAVVAAIAGHYLRDWSNAGQVLLAKWLGIYVLVAALLVGISASLRVRASRRAGKRLFKSRPLKWKGELVFFVAGLLAIGIYLGLTVHTCYEQTEIADPQIAALAQRTSGSVQGRLWMACMTIAVQVQFLFMIRTGCLNTYACENGLLRGVGRVALWNDCDRWNWAFNDPLTAVVWERGREYQVKATPGTRKRLGDLLNEYLPGKQVKPIRFTPPILER